MWDGGVSQAPSEFWGSLAGPHSALRKFHMWASKTSCVSCKNLGTTEATGEKIFFSKMQIWGRGNWNIHNTKFGQITMHSFITYFVYYLLFGVFMEFKNINNFIICKKNCKYTQY